jgi:hypothetical protein
VETFANPSSEQTNVWSSSSTGAVEWDADSTTLPSVHNVPFYLILSINASWLDFCDHLAEFKQCVATLMRSNGRYWLSICCSPPPPRSVPLQKVGQHFQKPKLNRHGNGRRDRDRVKVILSEQGNFMSMLVFWAVIPCGLVGRYLGFG